MQVHLPQARLCRESTSSRDSDDCSAIGAVERRVSLSTPAFPPIHPQQGQDDILVIPALRAVYGVDGHSGKGLGGGK